MTYLLHGAAPSPFCRKVAIVLEEKGLDWAYRDLVPFPKDTALRAKHPMGKIPSLEHDGRFVPDSSVICAYLSRLHPEPPIYPEAPAAFARALFLEEYADTRANEATGPILFERFVQPNVFGGETNTEVVERAVHESLPPALDYLESELSPGAEALLGAFSIADAAWAAQLGSLWLAEVEIDADRWPRVVAYRDKLLERPSVRSSMPR